MGYESPAFHVSVGPSWTGHDRGSDRFRAGILPFGVLRLRIGHQDRWHGALRLMDGVPSTAGGGAISLRFELAPPPRGQHRPRFGVYGSAAETTAGISASNEWPVGLPGITALRVGCLLGTHLRHASRPEFTCAAGVVF